jgi:hypothetical protein
MDKLTLQNENKILHINKSQALKLELRINLLLNKNHWIELGDVLYNFHALNKKPPTPLQINNEKFNVIREILTT